MLRGAPRHGFVYMGTDTSDTASPDPVTPEPAWVRESLARVLASDPFQRAPRMASLLQHIVETDLADESASLKGYDIGVAVFDKPADFDPSTDTLVRVETARLRRMLQNHYLHDDGTTRVEITVPKGAYRPAYAVRSTTSEVRASATEAQIPLGPTVVVHEIQVLSKEVPDVLALGLGHEIRHNLSLFSELLVINTNTAEGQEGVHFVVDGRIAVDDDRLLITLRLTDNVIGQMVWTADFEAERNTDDFAVMVMAAAEQLVTKMANTYGPIARQLARGTQTRPASSWLAWECVVEAHDYRARLTTPERNAELIKRVTDLLVESPDNAKLWAVRCRLELDAHVYRFPSDEASFDWSSLRARAEHAVSLDPLEVTAQTCLGMVLWLIHEVDASFACYDRALELNPNQLSTVYNYGQFIAFDGDWPRGRAYVEKARVLGYEPPVTKLFDLHDHVKHRNIDEAVRVAGTLYNRHWYVTVFWLAVVYGLSGDRSEGAAAGKLLLEQHPNYPAWGLDAMNRWIHDPEIIARCREGLLASGVEVLDHEI